MSEKSDKIESARDEEAKLHKRLHQRSRETASKRAKRYAQALKDNDFKYRPG